MIISERFKFVFVHIPKCAGSSVREQIAEADPSCLSLGFDGHHEALGPIDYAHLPLHVLRDHFPEYYASLKRFENYAILRDPLVRFGSAVRQTILKTEGEAMTLLSQDELRERTRSLIAEAAQQIDSLPHHLVYFQRQCDFVYDGDQRMVDHLYPIERTNLLLRDLGQRMNTNLAEDRRSNRNLSLKYKSVGKLAYATNHLLWRYAPSWLHQGIKKTAVKVLARNVSEAEEIGLLEWPEVQEFVSTYYQEDARLHKECLAKFN